MSALSRVLTLLVVSVIAIAIPPSDSSAVSVFDPGGLVCFEDFESPPECDGDPSLGAVTDIRFKFCVGWDDTCQTKDTTVLDSNSAFLAGFIPLEFAIPSGNSIPVGAIAGRASGQFTVGLIGNPCKTVIPIPFTMLNSSIDPSDEIDAQTSGALLFFDGDGNGIPDGADRYPSFLNEIFDGVQPRARYFGVTLTSGFLAVVNMVILEPGTEIRVGGGVLQFDSALGYPLVFVLDNPTLDPTPGPITDMCAPFWADLVLLGQSIDNPCTGGGSTGVASCPGELIFQGRGYPLLPCETGNSYDEDGDGEVNDGCPQVGSVSEADIPGACDNDVNDELEDSTVNDGCPQVGLFSEAERLPGLCAGADEGGCQLRFNPSQPGIYDFTIFALGYRDADGDGIDNTLDQCVLISNPGWDPYAFDTLNDPDMDGLANECDPDPDNQSPGSFCHPFGSIPWDEDQDCFTNRDDNCPFVWNFNQADEDRDAIGDVCDPQPQTADGELPAVCLIVPVEVAAGASTQPRPITKDFSGIGCVGNFSLPSTDPDPDADGLCTEGIDPGAFGCFGVDNCPSVYNPGQLDSDNDGTGDACENQAPIAVGGIAGLHPASDPSLDATGGSTSPLPVAAAFIGLAVLSLSAGACLALRRARPRPSP